MVRTVIDVAILFVALGATHIVSRCIALSDAWNAVAQLPDRITSADARAAIARLMPR